MTTFVSPRHTAIENLASQFRVTVQIIRRDLELLSKAGRQSPLQGGAGLPPSVESIGYTMRQILHPKN